MLELQPISYPEAAAFIRAHHRHHLPPLSWKFGIGANDGAHVVGVVTVGRPVARLLDDGWTLEVTRCCTDGTKHAASMLYAAAWRAAKALGYKRLITYTLASEGGGKPPRCGLPRAVPHARRLLAPDGAAPVRPCSHRAENALGGG